jgi:hypothetical protein
MKRHELEMDRLLLGDNQFFGINHMSEQRARSQSLRFSNIRAIMDVIDGAYEEGVTTFMCTTHDSVSLICDHVRANPSRYRNFQIYPCMPYAHKYADAVTEHGMLAALKRFLPQEGRLATLLQGGLSLARKDIETMIALLVDAEMKMFKGIRTPAVFIQNVVVDFLMGLGFKEALRIFADHVRARYGAEPGFITMNLPLLAQTLDEAGVEDPIVCANINKAGFRMCGSLETYARILASGRFRTIAMSVFASGAIPPEEAIEWISGLPGISSIVFGASSRDNIRRTRQLVELHGTCIGASRSPLPERALYEFTD